MVQAKRKKTEESNARESKATDAHAAASDGVSGPGCKLPHLGRIQAAFGRHNVRGVKAHVGGPAAAASKKLGADAYATGNSVAFNRDPDLHTAAHEAAHVVQQRAGLNLPGGQGNEGDAHEKHADAVADKVVAGESAEELLNQYGAADGGEKQQAKAAKAESEVKGAPGDGKPKLPKEPKEQDPNALVESSGEDQGDAESKKSSEEEKEQKVRSPEEMTPEIWKAIPDLQDEMSKGTGRNHQGGEAPQVMQPEFMEAAKRKVSDETTGQQTASAAQSTQAASPTKSVQFKKPTKGGAKIPPVKINIALGNWPAQPVKKPLGKYMHWGYQFLALSGELECEPPEDRKAKWALELEADPNAGPGIANQIKGAAPKGEVELWAKEKAGGTPFDLDLKGGLQIGHSKVNAGLVGGCKLLGDNLELSAGFDIVNWERGQTPKFGRFHAGVAASSKGLLLDFTTKDGWRFSGYIKGGASVDAWLNEVAMAEFIVKQLAKMAPAIPAAGAIAAPVAMGGYMMLMLYDAIQSGKDVAKGLDFAIQYRRNWATSFYNVALGLEAIGGTGGAEGAERARLVRKPMDDVGTPKASVDEAVEKYGKPNITALEKKAWDAAIQMALSTYAKAHPTEMYLWKRGWGSLTNRGYETLHRALYQAAPGE